MFPLRSFRQEAAGIVGVRQPVPLPTGKRATLLLCQRWTLVQQAGQLLLVAAVGEKAVHAIPWDQVTGWCAATKALGSVADLDVLYATSAPPPTPTVVSG